MAQREHSSSFNNKQVVVEFWYEGPGDTGKKHSFQVPGLRICRESYVGCSHGCVYCYAKFMKRFTGHRENWGEFVDVKINAPELVAVRSGGSIPAGSGSAESAIRINPLKRIQADEKMHRGPRDNVWPVTVADKIPACSERRRHIEAIARGRGLSDHHDCRREDQKDSRTWRSSDRKKDRGPRHSAFRRDTDACDGRAGAPRG